MTSRYSCSASAKRPCSWIALLPDCPCMSEFRVIRSQGRGGRHRAIDDNLFGLGIAALVPEAPRPGCRRPADTCGTLPVPVCEFQPRSPRAPVSPPRRNAPVSARCRPETHGLDRKRVLGSKNAALARQRLALQLLRFGIVSFANQNRAKLSHRLQRLRIVWAEKAQASVQGALFASS